MTEFSVIYDAFLAKMLDDEWSDWYEADVQEDLKALLMGALPWFKFPRVSLEYTSNDTFVEDLNNEEV